MKAIIFQQKCVKVFKDDALMPLGLAQAKTAKMVDKTKMSLCSTL